MPDQNQNNQISWIRVLIFFIIATLISNIFRFDVFELRPILEKLPNWLYILTTVLLEGSGVVIGALTMLPYLKKERNVEMTLLGKLESKSLIMSLIPIVIMSVIGVKNDFGLNNHLYGFIAIIGTLVYCIMEEYGWRGYYKKN